MLQRMTLLLITVCLLVSTIGRAQSLPWKGTIVFEDWVRVDDADSTAMGHPAIHPHTIFDEKTMVLYSVWEDDRDDDGIREIYFAKSVDTARTWTRPNIDLSLTPAVDDVYPWMCVDSNRIYVVWQSWRGNTWKVYLTVSADGGATWSAPDTVPGILADNDQSSGINFGPQPKIVADPLSVPDTTLLYLIWADGSGNNPTRVKLAHSLDGAASFSDLGTVDQNPACVNRHPFVAVDDSGWVHCAWDRGTGGNNQDPHPWIGYNRSTDRGATFMASDLIANDDSSGVYRGNPSLTYNQVSGHVLISWEDSRRAGGNASPDIWFSRVRRDSLIFEPNKRVNRYAPDSLNTYDNFRCAIRMDPEGIMVAAWHDDPDEDGSYGIHMAAYSDSFGQFGPSQSLVNTFTGTTGANFGNAFYAPALFVTVIDSVTNLFLVWQDYYEDTTGGNIYSIRGRVIETLADLDVDNDSLGIAGNIMDLRAQPAGPVYSPYAKGTFVLANTNDLYNPDSADGPSRSRIDSLYSRCYRDSVAADSVGLDSVFVLGLPSSMAVGQAAVCTVAVVVPVGTAPGTFLGSMLIAGFDSLGAPVDETFFLRFLGPQPRGSLDSLRIGPIPFTPHRDPAHTAIHFQGLPPGARVRVYDQAGALVWSSDPTDAADGHCAWPADKASGIYIYLVKAPDGTNRTGKLSVIR